MNMPVSSWFSKKQNRRSKDTKPVKENQKLAPDQILEDLSDKPFKGSLQEFSAYIQNLLGDNDDFVIRPFKVFSKFSATMFYFANLANQGILNEHIMKSFMNIPLHLEGKSINKDELQDILMNQILFFSKMHMKQNLGLITEAILEGSIIVVIEDVHEVFIFDSRNVEKRAITEPPTEQVIQGPRECFIEQLGTNLALLRYRLPTADFRVNTMRIGRITKSKVAICYLEGIVYPDLVKEVKSRLDAIDIDGILDAGYLEQFIEDHHLSPFPQILSTEKPDKAVANILEGRVAILVDGSPFALIAPTVFSQFYQTTEDYTSRFVQGSFVRLVRVIALVFSLIFPSLYVAIISFNPELIPTEFAVAVAGGRAGVPFPTFMEVLIMEVSMEVLREATIRLPQQVGGALSIVGVLVIGQAAVEAGFASPITVVVIALTTIGSFATPAFNMAFALRLLRFPLIVIAGMFGLYGVVIGLIFIGNHALSLKSFGTPYLSPAVPGNFQGMKDLVIRGPLWWMRKRPSVLHTLNKKRVGEDSEAIKQSPSNTMDPDHIRRTQKGNNDHEET
jgi:spore germination protein KA